MMLPRILLLLETILNLSLLVICASLPAETELSAEQLEQFRQSALRAHNEKRQLHGSPPLELNQAVNEFAQELAMNFKRTHSINKSGGPYGESFFCTRDPSVTGEDAVNSWYAEIRNYNWENPKILANNEDFTQLVWKRSTYLGIGVTRCGRGTYFLTAAYGPRGNVEEEQAENVLPLL